MQSDTSISVGELPLDFNLGMIASDGSGLTFVFKSMDVCKAAVEALTLHGR